MQQQQQHEQQQQHLCLEGSIGQRLQSVTAGISVCAKDEKEIKHLTRGLVMKGT